MLTHGFSANSLVFIVVLEGKRILRVLTFVWNLFVNFREIPI
jgi:hypothetical protein